MTNTCTYSRNTEAYLDRYREILSNMIDRMENARRTESISNDFIVQMIPHHMAAIEMAKNLLRYTTDLNLQRIADGIITEQTQSIEDMRAIRCLCLNQTNTQTDRNRYDSRTESILDTMFQSMENARSTNNIDCNFIREMIPHHEGAVHMSENALRFDLCPGLVPILHAIIKSQRRGIRELRQLQRRLGCGA